MDVHTRIRLTTYLHTLIAAQGGLLFGYVTGIIAGALLFVAKDYQLSTWQQAAFVSIVLVGAMIGVLGNGWFVDNLGRRKAFIISGVLLTLGSLLCSFHFSLTVLMLGRLLAGVGVGMASMTVPMYISEISPPSIRGKLIFVNSATITFGMLFAYFIGWAFSFQGNWQVMFAIGAIFSGLMILGGLFMEESPRWCLLKGDRAAARKVLKRIRLQEDIEDEMAQIEANLIHREKIPSPFQSPYHKVVYVGCLLAMIQQFTGINAVLYYAPMIFKKLDLFSNAEAVFPTIAIGGINFVFSIIAMLSIETLGRRSLMLVGLLTMMLSMFALSVGFRMDASAVLIVALFFVFVAAFAWSAGGLFWVLISEIIPLKIRGKAMGYVIVMNWCSNLFVTYSFLPLVEKFGNPTVFFTYGLCCLLSFIFCYYFVPETKNVALEVIEKNLDTGKPIRDIGLSLEG